MPIWEAVTMALRTIRAQKLKSFFSLIGVLIGVMFLIAVVSIVQGMNVYMEDQFANRLIGLNTFTLRRNPGINTGNVTEEEWRSWMRRPRITYDDAAYVATLITLADARHGRGFRRPVIFAAVTGEEKGLLGSRWLAANPTPMAPPPIAVLNLDQLRPLYPLTILTTLGLDDSTLGETVRSIAEPMGIQVRADLEPERGLLRRSDHWPFMQRGVPSVSFLFGVDPGTEAHARYIDWYQRRYHAPQDDLGTPIDYQAQAQFHRFYFALVEAVANADAPPQWLPASPYRPGAPR